MKYIANDAVISECQRYRYTLYRAWGSEQAYLLWVMLNPSTADATRDDATVRKRVGFTARRGFSSLYIVNLFAWRTRHPGELLSAGDPVGPLNNFYLGAHAGSPFCKGIVVAWGSLDFMRRSRVYDRAAQVVDLLRILPQPIACLGKSKSGDPRHPSRIGYDTPLLNFIRGAA